MTAPLVPIALAFGAGVALGLFVSPPGWVLAAGLALGLLAMVAVRQGRWAAATAGSLLLVGLAGWARLELPDPWPATTGLEPGQTRLEGRVTGDAEVDGPRTRFPLRVDSVIAEQASRPASGLLLVHVYRPLPPLRAGDRIRVTVELSHPRPFRNPGTTTMQPVEPRRRPVFLAIGRADSVQRLPETPAPWWLQTRFWMRRTILPELPSVSGALFEGLLIGERRQLPPPLLADFRAAGVFHILAISGFNIGLVAASTLLLLRLLRVPARLAAGLALGMVVAFAGIVGAQPSVLRATLMAGLVLTAEILGRESQVWNSLAGAFLGLLALEPTSLVDPGFQLSFAATAGILHLSPPIARCLTRWLPRPLATALAVSAGAQLAVTPLMAAYWNQFSLGGVVANLVVVPLAGALTVLGGLALVMTLVSGAAAHLLFQTLWVLLVVLRLVVHGFARLPGAMLHVPAAPMYTLPAIGAVLVGLPFARTRRARLGLAMLAAIAIAGTAIGYLPDGRFRVLVLDVGQGDAILVRAPSGQALLVDTGGGGPGRADRGERVVLPLLHRSGIRRLAALALTHGDPDHAGGLVSLLGGIPIDEVWIPAGMDVAPWREPLAAAGVPRRVLARGDRLWLGPLLATVLHPGPEAAESMPTSRDRNHGSLVLRVEWGLASVVLTGDAEARAEREALAAGMPLEARLLKVGHHGSRGGSSAPFLAAVGPRLGLISVGARNPFGHPSPAVLGRLAEAGAAIYRTDLDGAVEITSDAERLSVRRWAHPGAPEVFPLRGGP